MWACVRFSGRGRVRISVSKQAYKIDGKMTIMPPKTSNSVRQIALSAETLALLKKLKEDNPDSKYIFTSPVTGEMCHPDSVVNLHKKILKEAGLEHIRFHDLRHRLAGDGPLLSLRDISPAPPGELPSPRWPYRTAWT